MRLHRTIGLDEEQLDELEALVADELPGPWDKGIGRPRELSLREAITVAVAYLRRNIAQVVLADIFDVSQRMISEIITALTPAVSRAMEPEVPSAEEAADYVKGARCLVDGSLAPCWSWAGQRELWSGKHGTTGHNFQVITDMRGNVIAISDPFAGSWHDVHVLDESGYTDLLGLAGTTFGDKGYEGRGFITPVRKPAGGELLLREHEFNAEIASLRAPVERAIANIKAWRVLHTDYRRPLHTFRDSFKAAIGLYFFKLSFG